MLEVCSVKIDRCTEMLNGTGVEKGRMSEKVTLL
jgi:hypothetical protein